MSKKFFNPILSGDFPDPSIVRVGDDYYSVHSTFQYFPGIPVMHSKDLINWEFIGHVLNRQKQLNLTNIPDSFGVWAPDIEYYNGKFYVFYPLIGDEKGNFCSSIWMVSAHRPEGPYSDPVLLNRNAGIDPSLFFDDDGKNYLVWGDCRVQELSEDLDKLVGEPRKVWDGTGGHAPEGPHMFKRNGYYYLMIAEGGTGYGHYEVLARSQSVWGPFEPCPFNPILHQPDRDAAIQKVGHGKLVETQYGDWWMLHLGARPIRGKYCNLGRETFLQPVTWTHGGWFFIGDDRLPMEQCTAPMIPEDKSCSRSYSDDFNDDSLGLQWEFVRNPHDECWSLKERPGYFRIKTRDQDLCSLNAKNTLVQRAGHFDFTMGTKLEFSPDTDGEEAGIVCYFDTKSYIKFYLTWDKCLKLKLAKRVSGVFEVLAEKEFDSNIVYMKAVSEKQVYSFYYSNDNKEWICLAKDIDGSFLSCDWKLEKEGEWAFTGLMVGLYANNGGTGTLKNADFDWFTYEPGSKCAGGCLK